MTNVTKLFTEKNNEKISDHHNMKGEFMKPGDTEAKYCSNTAQNIDYCDGEKKQKQINKQKPRTQL